MKSEHQKDSSTQQRAWRNFGVILPVLGLLGASLSIPRQARANSGNSFLETIGISIAVGTVLGASTLPFYDQPGKHLMNLAYGASAGAVTGIGILVYGLVAGQTEDDGFGEADFYRKPSKESRLRQPRFGAAYVSHLNYESGPGVLRSGYSAPRPVPVHPAAFWMPVVSLNW